MYELPAELIAQQPLPQRDNSRLLVYDRKNDQIEHKQFKDIVGYFRAGDVLVLNNSKVIPARLHAYRPGKIEDIEILIIEQKDKNLWKVMANPARKLKPGTIICIKGKKNSVGEIEAEVVAKDSEGYRYIHFRTDQPILNLLTMYGETPLPPYIQRPEGILPEDELRYQTVYASRPGSIAAPTAGLHFTATLLEKISELGVHIVFVTLHVGPATFIPVRTKRIEDHKMHSEPYEIDEIAAQIISTAKKKGSRIIAVGTTTVRVLETIALRHAGNIVAETGRTDLYIYPPFNFMVVDALITNFHLPGSTLLMLVSAFVSPGDTRGREKILEIYRLAIQERYRFYSYGDAMLIL